MNVERVGQVWKNPYNTLLLVVACEPDDLEGSDKVVVVELETGDVTRRIFDDIEQDLEWLRLA